MKKETSINDPHAEREAEKYENPIPSREAILEFLESQDHPLKFKEIAAALHIEDEERLEALSRRLKAMVRDGQIMQNRRGAYGPILKMDLIKGRVLGHPDGYGFLIPEVRDTKDIFLPEREMRKVLNGDIVLVSITGEDRRGRPEGTIVEILERANKEVIGRLSFEDGMAWVRPENNRITQDIFIPKDGLHGAQEGQVVLVEILHQPSARSGPVGQVKKVLGNYLDPGLEIESALHTFNIPHEWSQEALEELDAIPDEIQPEDYQGRKDIRNLNLVTIDGVDSKDFDDAVYAKPRKSGGWRLVVAIADVSHYVKPGSALDKDAYERGNSVYFPQQVVPMLPEKLSNGLCSLNPKVDRLCMVCDMYIDAEGKLERSQFYQAVMKSKARLTYDQVYDMLTNENSEYLAEFGEFKSDLDELYALYKVLHAAREQRGALEFDTVETRIVFDDDRKIKEIVEVKRNDAHKLIEECMLMANVATARYLKWHKIPFLYRVHEPPTPEKIESLRTFLKDFGIELGGGDNPTPRDFAAVAKAVEGKPYEHLVNTVLLRSMNQAVYSPENKGHFGLNYDLYTHYTSPIRRYPDLLIHRGIRHAWLKQGAQGFIYTEKDMETFGVHCSATERRADEATRDVVTFLKCEFLSHHLGEEYEALVTATTNFGLFVELQPLYVEGLVHITELGDDYFIFDRDRHQLRGERTGKIYRLGDRLKVQVAQVNLEDRKIDLRLVADLSESEHSEQEGDQVASDADSVQEERKPRKKKRYYRGKRKSNRSKKSGSQEKQATK
ncbi:ribonuclease R [Galenea microaerophila]